MSKRSHDEEIAYQTKKLRCLIEEKNNEPTFSNWRFRPSPSTSHTDDEDESELCPNVLTALGKIANTTPKVDIAIHDTLVKDCNKILTEGLSVPTVDKLNKKYLIPQNFTLLRAPNMNSEAENMISSQAKRRDKFRKIEQDQLGVGLLAIYKVLNMLIREKNPDIKTTTIINILNEGCQLLSDVHYRQTESRQMLNVDKEIFQELSKDMRNSKRDDTLYGREIGKKIKEINLRNQKSSNLPQVHERNRYQWNESERRDTAEYWTTGSCN